MLQNISLFLSKEEQKKFNKLSLNQQTQITRKLMINFNELVDQQINQNKRNKNINTLAQ